MSCGCLLPVASLNALILVARPVLDSIPTVDTSFLLHCRIVEYPTRACIVCFLVVRKGHHFINCVSLCELENAAFRWPECLFSLQTQQYQLLDSHIICPWRPLEQDLLRTDVQHPDDHTRLPVVIEVAFLKTLVKSRSTRLRRFSGWSHVS